MKPCADKQKLIAWLALDALEAQPAREVRAHLETCAGCRSYLAELSQVTNRLTSVVPDTSLSASESFHRQVMDRIQAQPSASVGERLAVLLRSLIFNWRVAAPVTVAALLTVAVIQWPHTEIRVHSAAPVSVPVAPVAAASEDLTPTIANYQEAAGESLDKLDELLGDQGKHAGSSAPVYTAASRSLSF